MTLRSVGLLFLSLLLMGSLAIASGENSTLQVPVKPYPNSHFTTVDSVRIHYRTWNDSLLHPRGKIFLVHGFSGSTFCFRKNIEPLVREGFFVVVVDLPCFGYSERNPELNQSQSNRARMLWVLLDSIDRGDTTPWNIVGHSMGGGTVEAMAILRPGRTRSLTIIDGMVFSKNTNLTGAVGMVARDRRINKILVSYTKKNLLTYNNMRRLLKSAYGRPPDSTEVLGYLEPLLIEGTAQVVWGVWTHSKETVHLNADALIHMEVLIVWGGKDKWIRKSTGKSFLKEVPGAEMVIIQKAGHIPMETDPEIFNGLLLSFLQRVNPVIR